MSAVRLLDVRTGDVHRVLARSTDVICDVAVRPGTTHLAAGGADALSCGEGASSSAGAAGADRRIASSITSCSAAGMPASVVGRSATDALMSPPPHLPRGRQSPAGRN